MALINCPECNAQVSDQAAACPHCGMPLGASAGSRPPAPSRDQPRKKNDGTWRWIIGGAVGAIVLGGLCSAAANRGSQETTSGAPAATAAKPAGPPTPTALAGIGQKAQTGQWAAEVRSVETATRVSNTTAQGVFVIVTVAMTSLHQETSQLNPWDFTLKAPDGTTFSPSGDGGTAVAFTPGPPVPLLTVQVQPGLTVVLRVVFDVNPTIKQYTLEAAKVPSRIELP
jgi:Domain of unknown function (DUF4352)/zinc-ribbon domain